MKRQTLVEFEETISLPDGIHTFMTAKFPLFDSKGKVGGVGGICTDITERMKDLINNLQDFHRPSTGRIASMNIHTAIDSLL